MIGSMRAESDHRRSQVPPATAGAGCDHPGESNAGSPLLRVLVVEDEAKLRQSLAEGMRLEGWIVSEAETASEAFERCTDEIDLLVLDWMLPDGDGLTVIRQLRAQGRRCPVLVMTARDARGDVQLALESGASDFLKKPFSFDELIAHCRALVLADVARR